MSKDVLKKRILPVACIAYAYCSLSYLLNLAAAPAGFTNAALSVAMIPVMVLALKFPYQDVMKIEDKKARKRRIVFVLATGFLLGMSFVMGYQMRVLGMTLTGYKGKLFILLVSGGLAVAFSPFVNLWFRLLDTHGQRPENKDGARKGFTPGKCFLISWLAIFLCWIPVFLAYYPAVMAYDFHRQCLEAVRGFRFFNTYQPLLHTWLIWAFLHLGEAIHSYEAGMAIFCLLQMLILSAVLAYSCNMLGRLCNRKWPVVVSCLIFGLLPIHPVLAMSMTKDILFTAFLLLLLLLTLERRFFFLRGEKTWKLALLDLGMVASGILAVMFRNNAIYVIAASTIFYVIWSKGERIKILVLCAAVMAGGLGAKNALRETLGAGIGSNVEMCSVIIQTVARAAKNHESTLTEEQQEMCHYIVGDWTNYNPPLSDTIKGIIAETTYLVWKDEPAKMFDYWIKIGLAFPNDYIDAVLALTSGYWFLDDVSHAEVLGYGDDTNLGLLYTFNASHNDVFEGVQSKPVLPGLLKVYKHIVNGNSYYSWPGLSILFKPALYCWALVLAMLSLLYLRRWHKLVLCMLPFWNLMTLLLGPVVNMRYVYPFLVTAPILLGWVLSKKDWIRDEEVLEES